MVAISDGTLIEVIKAVVCHVAATDDRLDTARMKGNADLVEKYERDLKRQVDLHNTLNAARNAPKIDAVLEAARTLYKESAQFIFDSGERTLQSGITTGRCLALVADIDNILKTYSVKGEAHA